MNILLINHYAGSIYHGMEYRPYYMAREWVHMGHKVTIAAASFSHVRNIQPALRRSMAEETVDGIRYIWFKTSAYNGNGISRAINIITFVTQLLLHRNWIATSVMSDVVIASSTYPLDIIAARAIARKKNSMLVFEVHDLWPLSPIELGGMSRRHPFIVLMQWAENLAYRDSDMVISMLPNTFEHMVSHGMESQKFVYIPNGVDVAEWDKELRQIPEEPFHSLKQLKSDGRFLIGYAGAHGLANVLDCFIDAAYKLRDYPVTFVLIGQGPEKKRLIQKVQSRLQTNALFLPSVEKKIIPDILKQVDVLYIGLKNDPLFRFGVSPNKLMDYMMAAKPVIYAIQSGNDIVADSGCGISIPPENPEEIAKAVLYLMSLSEEDRKKMGQRGKAYILANHDYRVLAKQFITGLE